MNTSHFFSKILLPFMFILLCGFAVFGQKSRTVVKPKPAATPVPEVKKAETCGLALADAPALRGLKLGMPFEEIKKIISIYKIIRSEANTPNPDKVGGSSWVVWDAYKLEGFDGISSINFGIYKGLLFNFSLAYKEPYSGTIEEFTAEISDKLRLPKLWFNPEVILNPTRQTIYVNDQKVTIERPYSPPPWGVRRLECADFEIDVHKYKNDVSVRCEDKAAVKEIYRLLEEEEKKRKQNFKL